MTTGSDIRDELTGWASYYFDGSPQGSAPYGRYRSRVWAGGDSPTIGRASRPYERRFYTIVDRRGRVRKKSFKVFSEGRTNKHKDPHPYSVTFREFQSPPYWDILRGITGYWSRSETGPLPTGGTWPPAASWRPVAPTLSANDQLELINKLKERIRGSNFNMAVTLGESREALSMIGNSAIRIANGVRYARKGNFVAAIQAMSRSAQDARKNATLLPKRLNVTNMRRQTADQLSSNWLELQYGWLPLLSDIRSGAELVAHRLNVPRRVRYTAGIRKNATPDNRTLVGVDDYAYTSRRIIAYVSEQPDSIPRLSGLLDPELVAWELTPFSFVADWFLPIGDYLEARAFAKALTGTFVETTYLVENASGGLVGNSYLYEEPDHMSFAVVNEGGSFVDRVVTVNRTVSSSLNVPYPAVKPLSEALSWKHAVNGIALLGQVLKTGLTWSAPSEAKVNVFGRKLR